MRFLVICGALGVAAAASAGPISKFDTKPPIADYDTASKLEDIERCLIDMSEAPAPNIYTQPDRPDDAMIIWFKGVGAPGQVAFRMDLRRTASGTHVRSWMPVKQAIDCAPR